MAQRKKKKKAAPKKKKRAARTKGKGFSLAGKPAPSRAPRVGIDYEAGAIELPEEAAVEESDDGKTDWGGPRVIGSRKAKDKNA